ncbi:MAG TPA: hypothetical protein VFC53_13840 [Dehalococcoidia bacterium]|nr:hypothetical protein [Dehalococcoidia bacterium]
MRTLAVVLGLVLLALAAGASFVIRAAGAPGASLEYRCDPARLPPGVPTLVTCSFTARNDGDAPIAGASLFFSATAERLPDQYYFFRARRDGADLPLTSGQLDYPYGDLAPGARSTIEVQVIIQSAEPYGAAASLMANGVELARAPLHGDVTTDAPAPDVKLRLLRDPADAPFEAPGGVARYVVEVDAPAPIADGLLEVAYGPSAVAQADGWTPAPLRDAAVRPLAPEGLHQDVPLVLASDGDYCPSTWPAAVLRRHDTEGEVLAAALGPGAALGRCSGQGGGGDFVAPEALPAAGTGGRAGGGHRVDVLWAAAVGALLVAAGVSVRRVR